MTRPPGGSSVDHSSTELYSFSMGAPRSDGTTLSTVVTASKILEFIGSERSVTPARISRALDLTRSNVHRLLATLCELGYVEESPQHTYNLTFKLFELGNTVPFRKMIIDVARPSMLRLAQLTGLTVNNGILYQNQVLYVDKVEADTYLKLDRPIGSSDEIYTTSLGKVLLAFQDDDVQEAILADLKFFPSTPNTITDKKVFRAELEKVRSEGYATDFQELSMDLNCVAAPVFNGEGGLCSAVSVSGPSDRFTVEELHKVVPNLMATCREISWRIGTAEKLVHCDPAEIDG